MAGDDDKNTDGRGLDLSAFDNHQAKRLKVDFANQSKAKKEFDPMDPSSYSDAPAGGWGAGMSKNHVGTAGDDVDFQQYK